MSDTPEIIYLIHGEYEGEHCRVWCDDPAPSSYNDPAEAVKYVRADTLPVVTDNGKVNVGLIAENERLQVRVAELVAVAVSVRDDLLLRSEIDSDGTRCVNLSASKWNSFCDVIDDNNSGAFILRKQAEALEQCAAAIAEHHLLHPFGDLDEFVVAGMKDVYDFVVLRSKRLRSDADKAGG